MKRKIAVALFLVLAILAISLLEHYLYEQPDKPPIFRKYFGKRTVANVIQEYGKPATSRLLPAFSDAGVTYPPVRIALLGLKEERLLELWAFQQDRWHFIKDYQILGASGTSGPKLRQGDRQVPEGIYRITYLNPNSSYHLSMMLDYPNAFDRRHAKNEGRTRPGDNIFIHGKDVSIGCLAMGDTAIEELFILTAKLGKENVKVVIAPHDPRTAPLPRSLPDAPKWLPELYDRIEEEFRVFSSNQ